jgi:DNA-binding NtrC family response regulator
MAPILVHGERGTGKSLLSQYIHARSARTNKPLVFAQIAQNTEFDPIDYIFHPQHGKMTQSNGGTLVIKHIDQLSVRHQEELYERLFINSRSDVRLIVHTTSDLRDLVRLRRFLEDLYNRLNIIRMNIPPLRNRPSDIVHLAKLFVDISSIRNGVCVRSLSEEAIQTLLRWSWPGNVSELETVIERSVLLASGNLIEASDLEFHESSPKGNDQFFGAGMTISEAEKCLIIKTLEFTSNNKTQAARMLGISVRTLRNKLQEYGGVRYEQFV